MPARTYHIADGAAREPEDDADGRASAVHECDALQRDELQYMPSSVFARRPVPLSFVRLGDCSKNHLQAVRSPTPRPIAQEPSVMCKVRYIARHQSLSEQEGEKGKKEKRSRGLNAAATSRNSRER